MKLLFLGDYCSSGSDLPELTTAARALFDSSDLICVNFEGPIVSPDLTPLPKAGPVARQSGSSVLHCTNLGVTHASMANNHIMDYGPEGLKETLSKLSELEFIGAGLSFEEAYQPCWFERDGTRVALLSFAEAQLGVLQDELNDEQAGYAWIDHPRARRAIREARSKADVVVVQAHAGLEMTNLPLPELRSRYREFIDLGADLVVGHHPHVVQGSECYGQRMIHYSLGNFFMSAMLNQSDPGSGAALQVTIDQSGLISEIIPLRVSSATVDVDNSQEAQSQYSGISDKLLNQSSYDAEIDAICEEFWVNVYSQYYESALMGLGTKPRVTAFIRMIRQIAATVLGRRVSSPTNELMLIHNIRIESHRWVVARALANRIQAS